MKSFRVKSAYTLFSLMLFLSVIHVHAQDKQTLSVTPPLFQLSALPGDLWQSTIKVVNSNSFPIVVYVEVVNFEATGEFGQGKFTSIPKTGGENTTFAEWIEINNGPYTIDPEQTQEISFFAEMPVSAPPGGHYAAILVSTEPPKSSDALSVNTSQVVSSLLFVRVEGDVQEIGSIREFSMVKSFLNIPDAQFILRFENKGNVHLQPRGNIVLTNMWGAERGTIPINYQSHFGNVLPKTIREFNYAWKSDFHIADIGRYKAVATLSYGEDGIHSEIATTYFWVIPLKGTVLTLLILGLFALIIVLMVRAYVRRMFALAGVSIHDTQSVRTFNRGENIRHSLDPDVQSVHSKISAPIRDGVLDLRNRLKTTEESYSVFSTIWSFVTQYKIFFLSLFVLICIFVTVVAYISDATNDEKKYQVFTGKDAKLRAVTDK